MLDVVADAPSGGTYTVATYLRPDDAALIASAPQLLEALKSVEWAKLSGETVVICPWCRNTFSEGHAADCQRQAAVALLGDVPAAARKEA